MIGGKKTVALCTSRIYDPQVHSFIKTLGEALSSEGFNLLIYAINADLYWDEDVFSAETYIFDLVTYDKIEYLVYMDEKIKSKRVGEKIIGRARENSVPVIVIDGRYEGTVSVCFDYESGFEKIVRHVIEHHRVRRPHFMAGYKDNVFSDKRIEVFKKVIAENGIPFSDSMISYGNFWALPAKKATQALIDSGNIPDAVICANDIMALNVAEVLKANGYSVPSQIKVSGFDGYTEVKYSDPPIATMNCNCDILAKTVSDMIIKDSVRENTDKVCYVEPEEQFGGSCGCETGEDNSGDFLSMFNDKFYRYHDDARILHEMAVKMQTSDTPEKAVSYMNIDVIRDMCCITDRSCFRSEKYFFSDAVKHLDPNDVCIVYDSYNGGAGIKPITITDIAADTEKRLERGFPLIFNILDFMDIPMGFICYSFPNYDMVDYSRTANITSSVCMGLGGYINMRYQKYLSDKLEEMYRNDTLTGLYNRAAFNLAFKKIKDDPTNYGKPLHIIMSDLDGLKYINDNFGHDAGDIAISTSAAALRNACPPGSIFLRFGGDEMIAVIFGNCDEDSIIGRIEDYLKNFNANSGLPYKVATSCGFCRTELSENFEFESAVKFADQRMYINKKARKMAGG